VNSRKKNASHETGVFYCDVEAFTFSVPQLALQHQQAQEWRQRVPRQQRQLEQW
jgi:hypothetical protein